MPCFQGDPGPGYFQKEHAPYATQAQCEDDCTRNGACCIGGGCVQATKCECRASDGTWHGENVQCYNGLCYCHQLDEIDGTPVEQLTWTVKMDGVVISSPGPRPSQEQVNNTTLCLKWSGGPLNTQWDNVSCSWDPAIFAGFAATVFICKFDASNTYLVRVNIGGIEFQRSIPAAQINAPIVFSYDQRHTLYAFHAHYDLTNATFTVQLESCEPNDLEILDGAKCGFWCSPFGSDVAPPTTYDVTLSGVSLSGLPFNPNGTYTLTRYVFLTGREEDYGMYTFYTGSTGYLSTQFGVTLHFAPDQVDTFKATLSLIEINGMGYIGGVWSGVISGVQTPNCCPFDGPVTLTLTNNLPGYAQTNGTMEVHCD